MKKLTAFLIILLISSKSFCQVDTSKSKVDSLICLPKSLVLKTVQDLTKCDGEREEMKILQENYAIKSQQVDLKDSIIKEKDLKIADYKTTINAYAQVDTAHIKITNALTEKADIYRKERGWWRIAAILFTIVAIIK